MTQVKPNGKTGLADVLSTTSEMARMSDEEALARIGELRGLAHDAMQSGNDQDARALLGNAVQIAHSSYVGIEVIDEYADFLETHGFPEHAEEHRAMRKKIEDELKGHFEDSPDSE